MSGSIKGGSVSATTVSAITYINLPSGTAAWNANKLSGTTISFQDVGINPLSDNDTLVYTNLGGSFRWVNYPISNYARSVVNPYVALSGLSDVTASISPTNGQSLVWSSTKWIASSITGGVAGGSFNATAIQGVAVCATAPTTTNQAFVYDSTQSKWKAGYTVYQSTAIPNNASGANGDIYFQYDQSSTLSGLSDVLITTTPTTSYVLKWNGSKWAPAADDGGAGASPAGANHQFQFYKDGAFSAVQGIELVENLFGSNQLVLSGNYQTLYAGGSIYSPTINTNTLGISDGVTYLPINSTVVGVINIPFVSSTSVSSVSISATNYYNVGPSIFGVTNAVTNGLFF